VAAERSGLTVFINNGWYLPALSGGDLHVMQVAARWAQVRSVGIAMPGWAYRLHSRRLEGVRLYDTGRFEGSPPWPFAGVCLRWALRTVRIPRVRPTLVVAASQYPYDLIPGLLIARRNGSPLMVYVNHLPSVLRNKGDGGRLVGFWEPMAIRLLRRAGLVLIDNHETRRELTARGVRAERIQPTWHGTGSAPAGQGEQRRPDEVVYCGRITDAKGWQDLIVIGDRLRQACPGTKLRVLGDGERRRDLERAIVERGLSDVVQAEGFVDDETKWRALQRAAAFISPSREEGWGIAVSEALSAGAEVVCYDLPAYRVHGEGRLHLVPLGNVDALAGRLVKVLRGQAHDANDALAHRPPRAPTAMRSWDEIARHELSLADGLTSPGAAVAGSIRELAKL
jgi:glycosyltransferase involved in cell wall biosynthesis